MSSAPQTGERLPEDDVFGLLSARRRRAVLRVLDEAGGEATFGHITNEIATAEHGSDGDASQRKAVYVSLYQTHVPKLREAGVVEYDERTKTVTLTGPWRQVLAYLRFDPTARKSGLLSRVFRRRSGERAE